MNRTMVALGMALGISLLVLNSVAVTASNSVPASHLGSVSQTTNANTLKPSQCASLNLTRFVTGNGNLNGNATAELILGGPGAQTIKGNGGGDCIVGGAGADKLQGKGPTDICIGNSLTTFTACAQIFIVN